MPSLSWVSSVTATVLDGLINLAYVDKRVAQHEKSYSSHLEAIQFLKTARHGGLDAVYERYKDIVISSAMKGIAAQTIHDFERLFQVFQLPPVAKRWQDDHQFAWTRIAGPNPMSIQRVSELPDHFPVAEQHYARALEHHRTTGHSQAADNLARCLAEGRAYLLDFQALEGLKTGTYPYGSPKYLCAAMAFFAVSPDTGMLRPVAIQCGQRPSPNIPIFVPGDPQWPLAKMALQVADGNFHQAVTHLAWTHIVTEPVVLALQRTLAPNHPVHVLLRPHHEGTIFINDAAEGKLMKPEGAVDSVMSLEIETARQVTIAAVQNWSFADSMPERELAHRGLLETPGLAHFPYRDDALLVSAAIQDWVRNYLAIYYPTQEDIQNDIELANFFSELGSADGGRLRDIDAAAPTENFDNLVRAIAHLIYIPSAQHAAVNFPQLELMTYAPHMPLSAYAPPPGPEATDNLEARMLKTLPPLVIAEFQLVLGLLLGNTYHTRLGEYKRSLFQDFADDARADAKLKDFQKALAEIETTINERNQTRWCPYPYFRPSRIPQSVNI